MCNRCKSPCRRGADELAVGVAVALTDVEAIKLTDELTVDDAVTEAVVLTILVPVDVFVSD